MMFLLLSAALAAPAVGVRAIRVSALNEALALPLTQFPTTPLHPGASAAISFVEGGAGAYTWSLDAEAGGYYHAQVETALYLLPCWRPTWWVHRSVGLSGLAGVGYKHTLYPQPTYTLEEGAYVRSRPLGRGEATGQLGLGVAVRLSERVRLLAQYRGSIDGPFSSTLGIPVLLHTTAHLGLEVRR